MKRCPTCGRTYADSSIYCNQDAARLEPVRRWFLWSGLSALVLLLAAAGLLAPRLLEGYFERHITAQFKEASLHADPSWRWPPFDPNLKIALVVHNSAVLSPTLDSVHLACAVDNQNLATVEWPGSGEPPVVLASQKDTELNLKLSPATADPFAIFQRPPGNGSAVCEGPITVSLGPFHATRRLNLSTRLW